MCSLLNKDEDKDDYEDLMLRWIDYCEDIRDRARDIIEVLEAEQLGTTRVTPEVRVENPVIAASSTATDIVDDPGAGGSGMNRNATIEPSVPQPTGSISSLDVTASVQGSIAVVPATSLSGATWL